MSLDANQPSNPNNTYAGSDPRLTRESVGGSRGTLQPYQQCSSGYAAVACMGARTRPSRAAVREIVA